MNLTFCCQQATVITDFSDLDHIRRDHCLVMNGVHQYQALDGETEELKLI